MLPSSLTFSLDRSDSRTLPVQIADRMRSAISAGHISADTRLPSTRALAAEIGVARAVVEAAYEQLIAEGWLESVRGSGTYVRRLPAAKQESWRSATKNEWHSPSTQARMRLATGAPWVSEVTSAAWKRAWRDVAFDTPPRSYPHPLGDSALREAIAQLLARVRGLHVPVDAVVITTGSMHGFGLALSALRNPGPGLSPVLAHENPGYRVATTAAVRSGWSVFDIGVDGNGMKTAELASSPRGTRAVYVTPSHQYPTGGLLPIARRRALAEFSRDRDAMIIEDDYDSEFRYDVAPLPTVAELAPDRTIYLGTVAKTLGAGIRLGWLVAPVDVVNQIATVRVETGDYPSVPVQSAVLSLLRDGEWDRTVRTARRLYRRRDRIVSAALAPFGELRGVGAGMYTTLLIDCAVAEAVSARAAAAGVVVETLAPSTRGDTAVSGLAVGYGAVSDDELSYGLEVLTAALRSVS